MRAFIAIELPLDIRNSLAKIQDKLRPTLPKASWVKPINLHLSLKFLGEVSLKQINYIQEAILETIKITSPFEIELETLGVFPDFRQVRIIWIGTNQPPLRLEQLVEQLEKKLFESGIPKEDHPFRAHITLGRIKHPILPSELEKTLNRLKNEITGLNLKFNPRGITLFQSVLGAGGPTYNILKEADFEDLP